MCKALGARSEPANKWASTNRVEGGKKKMLKMRREKEESRRRLYIWILDFDNIFID